VVVGRPKRKLGLGFPSLDNPTPTHYPNYYSERKMNKFTTELSYLQLSSAIKLLDEQIKHHESILKGHKRDREIITDDVLPRKMEEEGLQTINVKNIGRLSVRHEMRVSTAAGKKFELQEWLKSNGYGELIGTSVNASTLKAFIAESIREGRDYPDELLNMHSFDRATLTKI